MYLKHFQLNTKPFQITADPKFLWLGEKHKEALATLRYGILDNRGFLLLTGEVGTGKTLLINRLIGTLDMDTVVATMPDPDLVSMDFYNLLADGLKMNRTFDSKGAFLIHLRDFLHQSYAERKQVVLIIDECQRLSPRLMEDVRVLSNIELQDRKLINIFFVGQQEFNTLLALPQNRALAQRITVRYHIDPLTAAEVGQYIRHRLKVAGSTKEIFKAEAVKAVYRFSGGIPRLINILSDHALLTAYARDAKVVDAAMVEECARELRIAYDPATAESEGTAHAPDTVSISRAVARSDGTSVAAAGTPQGMARVGGAATPDNGMGTHSVRRFFGRLLYTVVVLLLVMLAAFFITRFTRDDQGRFGVDGVDRNQVPALTDSERAEAAPTESGAAPPSRSSERPAATASRSIPAAPPVQQPADISAAKAGQTGAAEMSAPPEEESGPRAVADRRQARTDAAAEAPSAPIKAPPVMNRLITIPFTFNSNEIDEASYGVLNQIALQLQAQPDHMLQVRGYTDSSGSETYNQSVSRFRASAVKSYLVGKGAPPDRIEVLAMGSADPIASNATAEGRNQNRRVEIYFTQAP
ncbi:AAA family ATPase [Desulfatitalea alkaliphila]|uniref:OmpA family protein n=1 Tax=Desulfatitalea alkaliphila TaxID=2929485 RepID=A0AA41UQ68_9BACT|nr:AAA family ATPase [Desulfatitalea alkaliphila]MCJ8501103.1 OmpA family protein [Desulfatitalea alkaliphila]